MMAVDLNRTATEPMAQSAAPTAAARPALMFWAMLALAAAGGFVSLSSGVFFLRTISYASGGSFGAFAAALSALLVGLASGSHAAGKVRARGNDALAQWLVFNLILSGGLALAFLPLVGIFAWLGEMAAIGIALLLVFLITRSWGALLPCLAHLDVATREGRGWRAGALTLASIAGCAAGIVFTGMVLVEHLNLRGIAGVVSIGWLGYVGLLLAVLPLTHEVRQRALVALGILAVLTIHVVPLATTRIVERLQWKAATLELSSGWQLRAGLQ